MTADVVKTKSALNVVGKYEAPSFGITDIPDNQMIDGLKNFQQENGLKVDGILKPEGETAKAMEGNVRKLAKQYAHANGISVPDDQTEDEWLEEEMNKEEDENWFQAFLNWISSLISSDNEKLLPVGGGTRH